MPGLEDMGTLVVRFWRHLPPKLVMQAIDEIISHAQAAVKDENASMLTIGTGLGEAQFENIYKYRLFQLLPVIQELEPSRAESILNDDPNLAKALKSYPDGIQSLEPTYRDTPLKKGENPKFAMTFRLRRASAVQSSPDLAIDRFNREASEIVSSWQSDPTEALKKANELPDTGMLETGKSPKADALARIAAMAIRKRPDISDAALKLLLKANAAYPPIPQSYYSVIAAGIYYRMEAFDTASQLLESAMQLGAKLYELDTNSDNPNLAFKYDWPSAAVWRACVLLQDKIAPVKANALLKQISDQEIRAEIQVTLANTRMGVPVPVNTIRQQFGKEAGSVQSFPIPH